MSPRVAVLLGTLLALAPFARASTATAPYQRADHRSAGAGLDRPDAIQAPDAMTLLSQNRMALSVANYGSFGNLFESRTSSLEFPAASGYEHLTIAGLWVGARTRDPGGEFRGVSIAASDATLGVTSAVRTEYTGAGPFERRSTDPFSAWYHPAAVSEQDLLCSYTDVPARSALSSEPARPLNVEVRQRLLTWSAAPLRDIVFVRYAVLARGDTLRDVQVGVFAELASGDKNAYTSWPPSSGGSSKGGWFTKKLVSYDAPRRLLREHYCRAQPVPAGCDFNHVPPWIGLQLLTPPASGQAVTVAAWSWQPGHPARDQDVERHALMSTGTIADFSLPELAPQTGDPVEVLALGPFGPVAPGDSVVIEFAWVGGEDEAALAANADMAQRFRDAGYAFELVGVPDRDRAPRTGIAAVAPNPARAAAPARVAFALARPGPASLELFDVTGRRAWRREWSTLEAGPHDVAIVASPRLAPGIYLVRLVAEGGASTARLAVIE